MVTDKLGHIFNKESLIKTLIDKKIPKHFSHIRSLKDVFPVNFTPNPSYNPKSEQMSADAMDIGAVSPFICPVTNITVGSGHKFAVLKTCGCVFSERALKECPTEACLICNKHYTKEDVFYLNPDEEEKKVRQATLQEENSKKEKKVKKEKKRKNEDSNERVSKLEKLEGNLDVSLAKKEICA